MQTNTLIAFSAKAGSTARDGEGLNSPYTTALLNHIAVPGLDLRLAFGRVRDEVLASTSNAQEPFVYGSLGGETLALAPLRTIEPKRPEPQPQAGAPAVDPATSARRDYELAERVGTVEAWDSFLAVHNTGFYANLARAHRAKLLASREPVAQPATQPATPAAKRAPAQTPPPPKKAAEPKSGPPKSAQTILCGPRGCREVPPNCRVVPDPNPALHVRTDSVVCP